ncbi:MAG: dTMP kinase [Gemmatimonadetes bacterium]|nr:dTMP kinase [Gemmatimonadota bacterium]
MALIVFEGVEGAGKSTQLARVRASLEAAGRVVESFREPGGTPVGNEIRRVLLDPANSMDAMTEALLFMASRAELVAQEIRPALAAGKTVLLDRFFLSTYAYQVGGRGLAEADVLAANRVATRGLVPTLTILLTLSSTEGLERARRRGPSDRIESTGAVFHQKVEEAFARFATPEWQREHPECGPIIAVDGNGTADAVAARVHRVIAERIPGHDSLVRTVT